MKRGLLAITGLSLSWCFAGSNAAAAGPEDSEGPPSRAVLEQRLDAAQQRLNEAAREVAGLNRELSGGAEGDIVTQRFTTGGPLPARRAVLGINIGPFNEGAPEDGVEIVSVSPGGPAATAGLQAGDVLVEINGKKLTRAASRSPRTALLRVMDEVNVGDKVTVSFKRDGKVRKAEFRTRAIEPEMFTMAVPPPGFGPPGMGPGPLPGPLPGPGVRFFRQFDGPFGRTELVPLTPKLSQYFGTEKGLLVVRAPDDAAFQLEDGDVLLSIDGREPANPAHAARILGSYQAGEKLKIDVMRLKRRMTLEVTVPSRPGFEPSSFRPADPAEDVLFVAPPERT